MAKTLAARAREARIRQLVGTPGEEPITETATGQIGARRRTVTEASARAAVSKAAGFTGTVFDLPKAFFLKPGRVRETVAAQAKRRRKAFAFSTILTRRRDRIAGADGLSEARRLLGGSGVGTLG